MSDVERYKQIVGATPPVNSDGWFVDFPEEQKAASRLHRYLSKVWIYEHPIPDSAVELLRFDPNSYETAMAAYEATGGLKARGIEGGTLFETWALHQLLTKKRYSVLLSDAASNLPIDSITRVHLLRPTELTESLEVLLPVREDGESQEREVAAMINLGHTGHVIRLRSRSIDLSEVYFFDSWPGPSLLCDDNNTMGLRAQLVQPDPKRWSITRAEFERSACALILATESLTWTPYGETLASYDSLKATDLFKRFGLRETELFRATEVIRVQRCITKVEGCEVELEFLIDDNDSVRVTRVSIGRELVNLVAVHLSALYMHLFRRLEKESSEHPNRESMQALISEVCRTNTATSHIGATLQLTLGILPTEKGEQIVAEFLPA